MATQEENERLLRQFMDFSRREEQDKETVDERRTRESEERERGGRARDRGRTRQTAQETSARTEEQILEDFQLFLSSGGSDGTGANAAKAELTAIGSNADLIDQQLQLFQTQQGLGVDPEIDPETGGVVDFGTGVDQPSNLGANEGFFNEDPRFREEQLQVTPGGRGQLFNQFIAPNLPLFGGGVAQRAAQQSFQPLQSQFLLNQGLLGEFSQTPGTGVLFSESFGGGTPSGSDLRGLLGQLTDIIGNVGSQFDFSAPQTGFLEALSDPRTGRKTTFDLANSTFGVGGGNPFRNAFSNVLGRRFDAFLGGGGSEIDFLSNIAGGGGRF